MPQQRVSVLGLGAMGSGMARRLIDAGYQVTVYNRTKTNTEPLEAAGAAATWTPAPAAAWADFVLVSLADEDAVEAVLFGRNGAAWSMPRESILIDTSTVSPTFSRRTSDRIEEAGGRRVEAAVLGNPTQASNGDLRVFTAGDESDVVKVRELLKVVGREVLYVGPIGCASALKLAFNSLLGAQLASVAEALKYGATAGLDPRATLKAIAASGFASRVLAFRSQLALTESLSPAAFRTSLMQKDLRLFVTEAEKNGVSVPLALAAAQAIADAVEAGDGDLDAASILVGSGARGREPQ
jgi:3-hydroxyisobutyrate dehydrogenase-like beta-hydroxyacid dehydrogenase